MLKAAKLNLSRRLLYPDRLSRACILEDATSGIGRVLQLWGDSSPTRSFMSSHTSMCSPRC
eukprot:scaffold34613_cov166-Amphora_coffeaeformis.AAC.3